MRDLNVQYATIKSVIASGVVPAYYQVRADGYCLFAVADKFFLRSIVNDAGDVADFESNIKSICFATDSADDALTLGTLKSSTVLVNPKAVDGKSRFVMEKGVVTRTNTYLHNFCDPTTWYQQSTRVVSESPTNTGSDLQTYQLVHGNVIDLGHAKLIGEDFLKDVSGNSYRIVVKVNGTTKQERVWTAVSGGDYTVDYVNGVVLFGAPLSGGDSVTVTYYYAGSSRFTIAPTTGKKLIIHFAKAAFTPGDVVMNDTLRFDVYGFAEYFFTPTQMTALGYTTGQKVLLQPFAYKTMRDFVVDAHEVDPAIPAIGSGVRASPEIQNFDWEYVSSTALRASQGMEIRAYLMNDTAMSGTMCSASFYGNSEADT